MVTVNVEKLQTAFYLSGKSAEHVAREMDIDGSLVRNWRLGTRDVPDTRVYRLATALNVSVEYLLIPYPPKVEPEVVVRPVEKPKKRMVLQFGIDGMPMLPPGPRREHCSCGRPIHSGENK